MNLPVILRRNRKRFVLATILLGSLVFGARYRTLTTASERAPLRVLCARGWLDETHLNQFAARRSVKLDLYTYSTAGEFVRQMANANGQIDVVCAPSTLLRALVRSGWLRRLDYLALPHAREIEADFLHLPYDPRAEFAVPLFWQLYGMVAKGGVAKPVDATTRLWADELFLLGQLGARAAENEDFAVEPALHKLLPAPTRLLREVTSLANAVNSFVPLAQVAPYLSGTDTFTLPPEGAPLELGLLAVGAHAHGARLGLDLIDELLSFGYARGLHARVASGFVQSAANEDPRISPWLKPRQLRAFALTRLKFPDLDMDLVPRFERALKAQKILLGQQRDVGTTGQ